MQRKLETTEASARWGAGGGQGWSLVTFMPSQLEGWGLPVSDVNKPVLDKLPVTLQR